MSSFRECLERDVFDAARMTLGAFLVCGDLRARIVEVEAYRASDDPGSHAYRGKTPRNAVMFGRPGLAYVYFTYGMHWLLNIVAHPEETAAAVLIRAAEPLDGLEMMRIRRPKAKRDEDLLSGPAKITSAFGISKRENGIDLLDPRSSLQIVTGMPIERIVTGTRIGIPEGKGHDLPWRFCDGDSLRWVSKPLPDHY
jgi:DNA-3-methyladenine glycosylase